MANKMRYRWGPKANRWIAKTGTIAVEEGDMMKFTSSGKITPCSASGDSTALVGIARGASPATDRTATKIRVGLIGNGTVYEMLCNSATHTYGVAFVITGVQTLTAKTVVNLNITSTNVVAVCAQTMDAAGTLVLAEFLPGRFQGQISSTA